LEKRSRREAKEGRESITKAMTNEEQSKAARADTRQGQLLPSMTWLKRLASTDDVGWHGNEVKTRACPRSADGAREMIREEKTRPASASASPSKTDAKKPGSKALRTRLVRFWAA